MDKNFLKSRIKGICEYAISKGENTDWHNVLEAFGDLEEQYDPVDGFQFLDDELVEHLETLMDLMGYEEILGSGEKVHIAKILQIVRIYDCVNKWNTLTDY